MTRAQFAAVLLLSLAATSFLSPAFATFPDISTFESDTDSWTPSEELAPYSIWNEDETTLEYLVYETAPPVGFVDARSSEGEWPAVIEEVPSGWAGVNASHGDNFAVVLPEGFNAVYSRPGRSVPALGTPWSYQIDVYTDSRIAPTLGAGGGGLGNGSNGVPDFWWTNALNDPAVGEFGGYQTESGITAEVLDSCSGPVWRFTTTLGGRPAFDAAPDTWYTMEVQFHDNNVDGHMAATHRIWNHDHSKILYSETLRDLFQGPFPTESAGGPRYSWFTYFDQNMPRLLVDDSGVAAPIVLQEEASVAAGSNVNVNLAGGSDNVGGLEATFNQVTSGTFSSTYTQSISEDDLATAVGETAAGSINFALSSQPAQAWGLHFDGEFDSSTIVVSYDESSLLIPEADVRVMHYEDGVWSMPDQFLDTVNNTITFTTTSFSPFLLAEVPEPSTIVLVFIAAVSIAVGTMRRRV